MLRGKGSLEARTALFCSNTDKEPSLLKRYAADGSMSLRAIAKKLNDDRVPTVSGKGIWNASSVRRLKAISG